MLPFADVVNVRERRCMRFHAMIALVKATAASRNSALHGTRQ